ncbi:YdeI/OmpD-associated family protein [Pseudozobellia thermophila]|uniref:Uncharacterized conserved protein YdeI, YjbR/CyaY-like superfamily, DUF1801 family n=1 Tax=Pseudozobellia thermophila TaxID=192903 RepID=A0A1M6HTX0_9FLAO|nr:DUF1801 domain-containing protein [Pseudozobellia thermophila]SHJ25574.1 Uncharacterized conserved protein YdeI, YjbR/CyaY-like superfamily, DUF1801 family [Pseudozobellia thermophila]
MEKTEKIAKYYNEEHRFKHAIAILRKLALQTELRETFKWNFPTYTLNNSNILAICKFKNHFCIWFFNGVFLEDRQGRLINAQEGKTKAMRQWKFFSADEINAKEVSAYMHEAVENGKKGMKPAPEKRKKTMALPIPGPLKEALSKNQELKVAFDRLTPYRRRQYAEYIAQAKRAGTQSARLVKITPMILSGKGLNDAYR